MLHIVTGLPGSGKTEISKYLARKLNAIVINTDKVRDSMFPHQGRNEIGDFTPEQLRQVYSALKPISFYIAKVNPRKHFIIEGTFRLDSQRQNLINEMKKLKHHYKVIFVEVDDEEAKKRIQERFNSGKAKSTVAEYLEIKKIYERPKNAYTINNSGKLKDLYKKLREYTRSLKRY
ncbi:MAG TPA: ATP-binding protein [Patescibacteria group bacterium]|nr:ATP-binding protein [Patescibacteria group bacterium]